MTITQTTAYEIRCDLCGHIDRASPAASVPANQRTPTALFPNWAKLAAPPHAGVASPSAHPYLTPVDICPTCSGAVSDLIRRLKTPPVTPEAEIAPEPA